MSGNKKSPCGSMGFFLGCCQTACRAQEGRVKNKEFCPCFCKRSKTALLRNVHDKIQEEFCHNSIIARAKAGAFFRLLSNSLFEPRKDEPKTRCFVLNGVSLSNFAVNSGLSPGSSGGCPKSLRAMKLSRLTPQRPGTAPVRGQSPVLLPATLKLAPFRFVLVFVRGAKPRFCGAGMAKNQEEFCHNSIVVGA